MIVIHREPHSIDEEIETGDAVVVNLFPRAVRSRNSTLSYSTTDSEGYLTVYDIEVTNPGCLVHIDNETEAEGETRYFDSVGAAIDHFQLG